MEVKAPMVGKILSVKVKAGDTVEEGDELVILEAMKMEMPIVAPEGGTVKEVKVNEGDTVETEAVICVIE